MTLFFTSDHHFGHGGARGLFRRPYASTDAMDQAMIEIWNATIAPGDIVWYLGDLAIRHNQSRTEGLLQALNGEKHLVWGNNDPQSTRDAAGWRSVAGLVEITVGDTLLVLCHYPLRSWRDQSKGSWNLHGHSHGKLKPVPRQVDVGVDVWNFRPCTFDELRNRRERGPGQKG
ncbi:MAG: metallophosphoesterase [Geminicoccaceae bacterium]